MRILLFLSSLASFLLPQAQARNIETLGAGVGAPGIDTMWGLIVSTFPHTGIVQNNVRNGVTFLAFKITDFILKSIGALAVAMIVYAGVRMIAGGEEGLAEGKKIVMYAVIGLIAALCADAAVIFAKQIVLDAAAF